MLKVQTFSPNRLVGTWLVPCFSDFFLGLFGQCWWHCVHWTPCTSNDLNVPGNYCLRWILLLIWIWFLWWNFSSAGDLSCIEAASCSSTAQCIIGKKASREIFIDLVYLFWRLHSIALYLILSRGSGAAYVVNYKTIVPFGGFGGSELVCFASWLNSDPFSVSWVCIWLVGCTMLKCFFVFGSLEYVLNSKLSLVERWILFVVTPSLVFSQDSMNHNWFYVLL